MNTLKPFISSLTLRFKDIATYRSQKLWKSIIYVLILCILCSAITIIYKSSHRFSFEDTVTNIYAEHVGSDDPLDILIPEYHTKLIVGDSTLPEHDKEYKFVIAFGKDSYSIDSLGIKFKEKEYKSFPSPVETIITAKDEILKISQKLDVYFGLLLSVFLYVKATLSLFLHFIFIGIVALIGKNFYKIPITYKEAWTITAYGITLPIILKTIMNLAGINLFVTFFSYWIVVSIIVILTVKQIKKSHE